jgi:protein tyrosine/serine phosphatase
MDGGTARIRHGIFDLHQWRLWLAGLIGSRYDGLCHFHVVEPGVLMRCGQPRVRDLEQIRAEHGLRTVVCARGGTRHPLRGRWFRKERAYCEQAGIHLEHMPFDRFLALVQTPERRPVFVHCEQGFHRTGILVAAYRIRVCGWPVARAMDELRAYGYETERPKRRPLLDALRTWAQ